MQPPSPGPRRPDRSNPAAAALALLLSACMAFVSCRAQAQSEAPPTEAPESAASSASSSAADIVLAPVQVQGTSTAARDTKTLGQLLKAEQIFKTEQALAPQAVLMFKVFGRKDTEQWSAVDLGLLTPQGRLPVPLDAQGRFVLADEWRSLDADTELRSRLMDGKVTWRPDVRTPGSSAHLRRLGDLRLQCRASFFSGVARTSGLGLLVSGLLKPLLNGCDSKRFAWSSFADAPVFGIRLVHGERALQLSQTQVGGFNELGGGLFDWGYALRHQLFRLPMGDNSWPDDARVEFELVNDPQAPVEPALHQAPGPLPEAARSLQVGSPWDEIKVRLGRYAGMTRYDNSGLRVVRYTQDKQRDVQQGLELVLLFDAQDRLIKHALRPMGEHRLPAAVPAPWGSR